MKIAFVGGGALRLLGTLRGAMAHPDLLEGGEIRLYDLNVRRAEALGRMLMKTPEYQALDRCRISWPERLEDAVEDADYVGIVLRAGSAERFLGSAPISREYGYMHTDNLSPNGAFLAMKGAPIVLGVARAMERLAPDGWLVDFANPVAVHSALVNRYTRIRAIGVCEGYTNHLADLSRLCGRDENDPDWEVTVAGVNHLSYIINGNYRGEDIFAIMDRVLAEEPPIRWREEWRPEQLANMRGAVEFLREVYRELGVLVFSTEGDGMAHLRYDRATAGHGVGGETLSIAARLEAEYERRARADNDFRDRLHDDLNAAWWQAQTGRNNVFTRDDDSIFTRTMIGIGGSKAQKIVVSSLNNGAVAGLANRLVLEYSQVLEAGNLRPVRGLRVPTPVYGITAGLANYQTMLADGLGREDPTLVARALKAYPIRPFHDRARDYFRAMADYHRDELPEWLRGIAF